MNGYLIARFDMNGSDAASTYKRYVEAAAPAYAEHEARLLVRGGTIRASEGPTRGRNVVIEYPSVALALACYKSDTYQRAREHRIRAAEGEIVIIEGAVKARPQQDGKRTYWIARQDVTDLAEYKKYVEGCGSVFADHGGIFLVRGGPHQAMEGQARERNVLIEFPSVGDALACWESNAYRAAAEHRRTAARGEIVIVEGT